MSHIRECVDLTCHLGKSSSPLLDHGIFSARVTLTKIATCLNVLTIRTPNLGHLLLHCQVISMIVLLCVRRIDILVTMAPIRRLSRIELLAFAAVRNDSAQTYSCVPGWIKRAPCRNKYFAMFARKRIVLCGDALETTYPATPPHRALGTNSGVLHHGIQVIGKFE